jgi:hypothetical protein
VPILEERQGDHEPARSRCRTLNAS